MPRRKNTKRFDPRYFLHERMEGPLELEDEYATEESYPGDGEEPVLDADELGLGQMNEAAELVDLALSTALGVATIYGAHKIGSAAGSILGRFISVAERELRAIQRHYKDKYRVEIEDAMKAALDNDPELEALAMEYQELTDRVKNTPDAGGIKGLRGSEYADVRAQQKEVAKQFAIEVREAIRRAAQSIEDNPDLQDRGSKLTGDDAYAAMDAVRQHARRRR